MIDADKIREKVQEALPGAEVSLRDLVGDRDHYEMIVVSSAFEGKTTLERHRLVYAPLRGVLGETLHALALRTIAPSERTT
ncbi:MAG: BolA/IbaG family iron-sulfur metabolism protein [Acidobacteriota bacterium]